ncbi:hypothetical protein FG379_001036 [Cryptosporidium bovis]|uniref:uncharacterized protein n=1 Tax=Cryptosporidium bovis TaxID=310047 RepID=UPI003519DDD0|nr:hypothetical protein FG379_001036 [Cryptosporidium bovis]
MNKLFVRNRYNILVTFNLIFLLYVTINNRACANKVDLDKIIVTEDGGKNEKTVKNVSSITLNNSYPIILNRNETIDRDGLHIYINQSIYGEFVVGSNGDILNGSNNFDTTIRKINSTIQENFTSNTSKKEINNLINNVNSNSEGNNLFLESNPNSTTIETDHNIHPTIESSSVEGNGNINVISISFSTIYDDLLSDPDLKDNVEYTIFNTSDNEKRKLIESQLKKSDATNMVLNINDISSYGFVSWIRPVSSDSSELTLQSASGIMRKENISFLKSLFPRRNFTNDELDIIILSESSQEVRPYGYRGSPIILTQYIENIVLNRDEENEADIIALMETIETLNQTSSINNNKDNHGEIKLEEEGTFESNGIDDESHEYKYWLNSFLLHDEPDILSINCDFYTEWSNWSSCTNDCGWGIQTRGRRINANKAFKKTYISIEEQLKKLNMCKVQIQTQGCSSKAGCCEYTRPKEDSWADCSATYEKPGFEEQLVELISNRKGNVSDGTCIREKKIKRKCIKFNKDDNFCATTEWSEWSTCENGNGNYVQKRERKFISNNCTETQTNLHEDRICDYLPIISSSPTPNELDNFEGLSTMFEEQSYKGDFLRIEECLFVLSEAKYSESTGSCKCPSGMKLCSADTIENYKSSWKHHAEEICSGIRMGFTSVKGKLLQAIGNRTYNCELKDWDKYTEKKDDLDCVNTFVLCKLENNCIVSSWSEWSGCSSPCIYQSSSRVNNISSFRQRTRNVISGSCSEHLLLEKEECSNLMECPQMYFSLKISKKPKEMINEIFKEENKETLISALNLVKEHGNIEHSPSSVARTIFNEVKNIIINNTVYLLKLNLNETVIGADGKYHENNFVDSLLSNFNFNDKDLVADIISNLFINGKVSEELYNNLTLKDKSIIGSDYSETAEFIGGLFSSLRNTTESNDHLNVLKWSSHASNISSSINSTGLDFITNSNSSGATSENLDTELLIGEGNLGSEFNADKVKSKLFNRVNNISSYLHSKYKSKLNNIYEGDLTDNSREADIAKKESISENGDLTKILNGTVLISLIEYSIISHSNCKPMEAVQDNLEQTEFGTNCRCPSGYILCSSIDYLFGNKTTVTSDKDVVNIGNNVGVFSDNFVLNEGDMYNAIYETDKEKYCSTPGANVMCSSESELIKSFENHDVFNLYSEHFHFEDESSEE